MQSQQENFMAEALRLAKEGGRDVLPNPRVGAVIVKEGKIIASGYHRKFGEKHAEIAAIESVKDKELLRGAELYVNLEPCCHWGKTPPCIEEIYKAGIKKVIIAIPDPNPKVYKKSISTLKKLAIDVEVGILAEEAKRLNEDYIVFMQKKRPFCVLKLAISLDGKIKDPSTRYISCDESRSLVKELRDNASAILIGKNTLFADNPRLFGKSQKPYRIILDSKLECVKRGLLNFNVFKKPQIVIIATTERAPKRAIKEAEDMGIKVIITKSKDKRVNLKEVFLALSEMGLIHIFCEGGREVASSLLKEDLVDKLVFFIAPKLIGGGFFLFPQEFKEVLNLKDIKWKQVGRDILFEGYIEKIEV